MATKLASLVVELRATSAKFRSDMGDARRQIGGVKDSVIDMRKVMAGAFAVAGAAVAAKKVFDLGAAVEETASKFRTVFGPAADDVQSFIDEFGTMAGLTTEQAQGIIATTGAIAQGMGYAQQASAGFAVEVTSLAADLQSFNDVPIEETSRAIQAAITGEREQLKRLGIVLRQADVDARALAIAHREGAAAVTDQHKAAATLALIAERAGVAVGDLARTQDSAANRARKVAAEIGNLRDALAVGAMPVFGAVLEELGKISGAEGLSGLADKLRAQAPIIEGWAKFAVQSFKTVAGAIAAPVRLAFNLGQVIGGVLNAAFHAMRGDMDAAREAIGGVVGDFADMKSAVGNVIEGFDDMRVASATAWAAVAGEGSQGGPAQAKQSLQEAADAAAGFATVMREQVGGDVAQRLFPELISSVNRFNVAMAEAGFAGDVAITNFGDRLRQTPKFIDPVVQGLGQMKAMAVDFTSAFANTLVDATTQGIAAFKAFGKFVLRTLAQIAAKMLIFKALQFLFPGAGTFLGGVAQSFGFAGGFADGGRIPAGQVGLVGERGPEFIRGPAHITPMHQAGGMGGGVLTLRLEYPDGRVLSHNLRYRQGRDERLGFGTVRAPLPIGEF